MAYSRRNNERNDDRAEKDTVEKVVFINRCAKVVKGGRRFSFSALIVVGDRKGKIGIGFGKAKEVIEAIRKGTEAANKRTSLVPLDENTIPHEVIGEFGGARVMLRPASPGTGVIAGGSVRAVMEAAGIRDVLAKSLGSGNPSNVAKAAMQALSQLRPKKDIFAIRGKKYTPRTPKVTVVVPAPAPAETLAEVAPAEVTPEAVIVPEAVTE